MTAIFQLAQLRVIPRMGACPKNMGPVVRSARHPRNAPMRKQQCYPPKRTAWIGGDAPTRLPGVAGVDAAPQATGGAAHQQRAPVVGHGQAVAIDQVVAVRLRQAGAQRVEGRAAVARAGHGHARHPRARGTRSDHAGTNQAVPGVRWDARPRRSRSFDAARSAISRQERALSVERQMPL